MPAKSIRMSLLMVTVMFVAACGGNGAAPGSTSAPGGTNAPGPTSGPTSPPPPTGPSGDQGGGTLTIGGETWELSSLRCAIGEEETRSTVYPFSARGAVALPAGTELSIVVEVTDLNEEGRLSGNDVIVDEIMARETGDSGSIDWRTDGWVGISGSLLLGDQASRQPLVTSFTIDESARTISVQGTFINMLAGEPGNYPDSAFVQGSFEGRCGG